jgi:hypothetical protein
MLKTSSKLVILLVVLLPALEICFQAQPSLADTSIEQLNDKLLELQRKIIELQNKYDSEVNVINEQINQFDTKSGEKKARDELASVQDSAKT